MRICTSQGPQVRRGSRPLHQTLTYISTAPRHATNASNNTSKAKLRQQEPEGTTIEASSFSGAVTLGISLTLGLSSPACSLDHVIPVCTIDDVRSWRPWGWRRWCCCSSSSSKSSTSSPSLRGRLREKGPGSRWWWTCSATRSSRDPTLPRIAAISNSSS